MDGDDAALLAAVADGRDRAFNMLIDRHQQALRTFLRGLAGADEADDIAQETFLAMWTQAKSYRGQSSVRSWLFAIAWRKAKGAQRTRFRGQARDFAWVNESAENRRQSSPDDMLAVRQALATLPLDQRAALMLCLGCDVSHGEAAEALGLPLGTVKSHIARGRARLYDVLGEKA
jgi:RNA polymerase sigma-70 factor (ECF subfamily)